MYVYPKLAIQWFHPFQNRESIVKYSLDFFNIYIEWYIAKKEPWVGLVHLREL